MAKLLTSFTHRRRVDDRHDLFDVVADDLVEQGFIATVPGVTDASLTVPALRLSAAVGYTFCKVTVASFAAKSPFKET